MLGARRHIGGTYVAGGAFPRDLNNGGTKLIGVSTSLGKDVGGNALLLADKAEKEMLRADIGMSQLSGKAESVIKDVLCFLCKADG